MREHILLEATFCVQENLLVSTRNDRMMRSNQRRSMESPRETRLPVIIMAAELHLFQINVGCRSTYSYYLIRGHPRITPPARAIGGQTFFDDMGRRPRFPMLPDERQKVEGERWIS